MSRPSWQGVLVVGEAPGPRDDGNPISGRVGNRLSAVSGAAVAAATRRNLLRAYPGPARGNGSRFPLAEARAAAAELPIGGARAVVLLGKRTAAAFRIRADYFERFELDGRPAIVVPHPSGANRWWNEPLNLVRARVELRRFLA